MQQFCLFNAAEHAVAFGANRMVLAALMPSKFNSKVKAGASVRQQPSSQESNSGALYLP